ncbi:MAG: hypothetical protein HZB38_19060 [Planctomycetes bacterium]|nr:hypothetical protein [Planctomycetota bacterium]
MKTRNQDFLLGLVVLICLAVFVGTFLYVFPRYAGPTKTITVHFRHEEGVAPLKKGCPVTLAGAMQVGKVTGLRRSMVQNNKPGLPPTQLLILVEASIDADLTLYQDCQISTDQPPVGGGGTLVILSVGTPEKGTITSEVIDGLPPQSFAAAISGLSRRLLAPDGLVDKLSYTLDEKAEGSLVNKLSNSLSDLNAMTADLRTQLSAREEKTLMNKLHLIFDDFASITAELRAQMQTENTAGLLAKVNAAVDVLSTAMREAGDILHENRPAIASTVGSIESVTRTLDVEIMAKLKRDFDRDDPSSLLGKLHVAMSELNTSMKNIAETTDSARSFVVANRPALDRMTENLKAVSDQMRTAVQELALRPWRLFQPPGSELKRLDVFEAARNFSEAATLLDDASARLEAVVTASAGGGRNVANESEIREIQSSLQKAFERYRIAEDVLFEKLK